jgi:D-tyrosyl-tRNA(Tyr) deacylase
MRAVIQRVSAAAVSIDGSIVGQIGRGLLVLLGIEQGDSGDDLAWLSSKVARLRVFPDEAGRINRNLREADGGMLVVSQFTLHASTRKGNRPSFTQAAAPAEAEALYREFLAAMEAHLGQVVERGRFGADMQVSLVNDGPVTLMIDSRLRE